MEPSLNWVEFFGGVGAGKTTLAHSFCLWASSSGRRAFTPDQAIPVAMARTMPGKWLVRILPKRYQERVLTGLYHGLVKPMAWLVFSARHKELVRSVGGSSKARRTLTGKHNQIILRLFNDVAALYQFVLPRLKPSEMLVLDEGFFQRAVNLFAWESGELDCSAVQSYFYNLPEAGLVVIVHTPGDVGMERAEVRGLPIRLRDKSPQVVHRFKAHTRQIVDVARESLTRRNAIEIDNEGSVEDAAASLVKNTQAALGSNRKVFSPPAVSKRAFIRIQRPDRLVRHLRYQLGQAPVLSGVLNETLALWGLKQVEPAYSAGGPGRSESMFIPTNTGIKFLKRYKQSLDREWINHEHSILKALSAAHFPAPQLVPTLAGGTIVEGESGYFALFEVYDGYFQIHNNLFIPRMDQQFVSLAGQALAVLHATLRDFKPDGRNLNGFSSPTGSRWREMDWYLERLARCTGAPPAELNGITSEWMRDRLQVLNDVLNSTRLERLIIHGDYGPYNLLYRQGRPVVVLDFELARLDWRLIDLCSAFFYFAHGKSGFRWEKMRTFLDAYRSVESVDQEEMRSLPLVWEFITLRRLVVLWERFLDGDHGARREMPIRRDILKWVTKNQVSLEAL